MIQKSYSNNIGNLYVVPTPIGNLQDVTKRAIDVLKMVDYILCEDTRTTKVFLDFFSIKSKLVSCHEFNENSVKEKVIIDLKNGLNIAMVTDQGTPIISDPGYKVVSYAIDNCCSIISLPGATAFTPALTSSGLDPSHFLFYGFLNSKKAKRIEELKMLERIPFTIILYESVHRCSEVLGDILQVFGDRKVSVSREISKIHEEIYRGHISEVIPEISILKGEFVIVIDGNKEVIDYSNLSIKEHVDLYARDLNNVNDAIKIVAKERNVPKSIIYKEYHGGK